MEEKGIYAKTNGHVFFRDVLVAEANAATFEVAPNTFYAHDDYHVYYQGNLITESDGATFEHIENEKARDAFRSYNYGIPNTDLEDNDSDAIAQCLTDKGVKLYYSERCIHCIEQQKIFGTGFWKLDVVDCINDSSQCTAANIQGTPTWEFADGLQYVGVFSLEQLAEHVGCDS